MIIDKLENAPKYYKLGQDLEIGLKYLQATDLKSAACQKHVLDGEILWANVQDMDTKNPETTPWEIHRKYTDIQYVITGKERMDWANKEFFIGDGEYSSESDIQFGNVSQNATEGSVIVNEGYFVIFTSNDAHKPALWVNSPEKVKKVIVKVRN